MTPGTTGPTSDGSPHRKARGWRFLSVLAGVVVVGALVWALVVGYIASTTLMYGDGVKHGCPTPAVLGWAYEAVNYDITLDERLATDNPDWLNDCPNHGAGTAGTDVVSSDGVRVAGWYIPSGDGDAASAPTVLIVHGWGVSKSDALRYAVPLHDAWNLLLMDTRAQGRSSGDWMTFGVTEVEDVRAMLDWLERTKHPSKVAVLGDSGGAAAAAKLARTDDRIAGLILESAHARLRNAIEQRFGADPRGQPVALTVPIGMVAFWVRTGVWLGDADPLDAIADLGDRPLAISYGTRDASDVPELNAQVLYEAALAAGVPVEAHACEGATHGKVIDTCPEAYRVWVNAFLERVLDGG
jgi:pimeloyl-ACP methyl ester carboxylesterase